MNKKKECLAMFAMKKKSFAFTLAEVLIVLAVLGVIAAMTIPTLIQDAREKALITALKKNYTIFSQAIDMAQAENGSITSWDVGGTNASSANSLNFYNILKPYLRIEKECERTSALTSCFAEHYEALFYDNMDMTPLMNSCYLKGILASGSSFALLGRTCANSNCGVLFVDVNGQAGPNKAGVDFFKFGITSEGLQPSGYGYVNDDTWGQCAYKGTGIANGFRCTYWAIKHENMDYLRKDGKYTKF